MDREHDKKPYETPQVYSLGTVAELTKEVEKSGGSGDAFQPAFTGLC